MRQRGHKPRATHPGGWADGGERKGATMQQQTERNAPPDSFESGILSDAARRSNADDRPHQG